MHVVARCKNQEFHLAVLRYLDRNPVQAGRVTDPTTFHWSSCAASALGTSNRALTVPPNYLALRPDANVRQRQDRTLLALSEGLEADARWTTQRASGSPAFLAPSVPRRGRRRSDAMPAQNHGVRREMASDTFSTKERRGLWCANPNKEARMTPCRPDEWRPKECASCRSRPCCSPSLVC